METCQLLNYMDQIYLNYEILMTEIWNMSPEIFLKDDHFSIFESLWMIFACYLPFD